MVTDKVIYLYKKQNPIQKFMYYTEQEASLVRPCELSLLAMFAIDEVIHSEFAEDYHFYIYKDESIAHILNQCKYEISSEFYDRCLYFLDYSKLIYRFTCAKKFHVMDSTENQLRLNSWGRYYLKQIDFLNKYRVEYKVIFYYIEHYIIENKAIYRQLINLLLGRLEYECVKKIDRFNQCISIKLLS